MATSRTSAKPVLVSHQLCPYVQRVAIVLAEKGVDFERRDIDLSAKPDWFLAISPLGKTPVLLTGDHALFESSVICEYLDDTLLPKLHPANALQRARHRAWMEFGSNLLNMIGAFYRAPDAQSLQREADTMHARFRQIEDVLGDGPYFDGPFSMVDAVFGPVFRYFDVFDDIGDFGIMRGLTKVQRWRHALAQRDSVSNAVNPRYPEQLRAFLVQRGSALAALVQCEPLQCEALQYEP
ncbi:MAG: glutathione S-transferase family protein [Gammaproteobacteria bacterium]